MQRQDLKDQLQNKELQVQTVMENVEFWEQKDYFQHEAERRAIKESRNSHEWLLGKGVHPKWKHFMWKDTE